MIFKKKYEEPSEDMFADTRMSFGEHIEDLRKHLIRAIVGFVIAVLISFSFGHIVLEWIKAPVAKQLEEYYKAKVNRLWEEKQVAIRDKLEEPQPATIVIPSAELAKVFPPNTRAQLPTADVRLSVQIQNSDRLARQLEEIFQEVSPHHDLIVLSIMEAFMAWVKVCVMCGLVLGSPWIFTQIWAFVAAGLYPHEKRLVNVYLPVSIALFLTGVFVCYFVVLPKAIQALLWFNHWTGLDPELRFSDWLGFAIMLPAFMGVCFQLPLVMYFLERLGIFTIDTYVRKWRIATFVIFVIALLPTMDMFTPFLIAIPMIGLYWLGIFLCKLNPRSQPEDMEPADSQEELIEV